MSIWTKLLSFSLASFFKLMPLRVRWAFGAFLGWLWFDVLKLRRWTIMKNLSRAFPNMPKEEKYSTARLSMKFLCYNFAEICLMPFMDQKYMEKNCEFHGLENYEKAKAQGKGLLLMSLHMGNGDVGTNFLTLKGLKVHVISKKFKVKFLNDFWFGVRESKGAKFINPHGRSTPFDILKAVKAQESVVFVIDQFMGRPYGIPTTFFGKKTGTAYGLALFAIKTGSPVLPVYTYRDKNLKTHVVFEPEIKVVAEGEDRDLQISRTTQVYNNKVEEIVRRHPEQWMWVHRRWKAIN